MPQTGRHYQRWLMWRISTKCLHSREQLLILESRLPADAGRRHRWWRGPFCHSLAIRLRAPPKPKGYAMASWHTPKIRHCQACHHEFRRMLSAEDAKPQSNNRTKSDLGHVGRRFVGAWVSGYVWYFEVSREPKHAAQQMRHQQVGISQ